MIPLAKALYYANGNLRRVELRIENFLRVIFPGGWHGWSFHGDEIDGLAIDVFGVDEHVIPIRALLLSGFVEVRLHHHRPDQRLITCTCRTYEAPRRELCEAYRSPDDT